MKLLDGAWIIVLLVPTIALLFLGIRLHYLHFERECVIDLPLVR